MKKRLRGANAVATAALLLAAITSCADNTPGTATRPSPTPPVSSTPSATTPTPPTDSEQAATAATLVLRDYFARVDALRQEPTRSTSELADVAIGIQLAAEKRFIRNQRKEQVTQKGSTKVSKLIVQSVNLDNSDPSAGKVPTVQVDACYDVSEVDILDADGKSIVNIDRPESGWIRFTVANYDWDTDPAGGWRVASGSDLKRAPCAAS